MKRALAPVGLLVLAACSGGEQAGGPPALPVTVAAPLVREVTEWDDYVGRFEAVDSVEVRPRATGFLQRAHFTDGQYVRATIAPFFARYRLARSDACDRIFSGGDGAGSGWSDIHG